MFQTPLNLQQKNPKYKRKSKIKKKRKKKDKQSNKMIKYGRNSSEPVASGRTQPRESVASLRKTLRPGRWTQSKINFE